MFKTTKLIFILSWSLLLGSLGQLSLAQNFGYLTINKNSGWSCDQIKSQTISNLAASLDDGENNYFDPTQYYNGTVGLECFSGGKVFENIAEKLILVPFNFPVKFVPINTQKEWDTYHTTKEMDLLSEAVEREIRVIGGLDHCREIKTKFTICEPIGELYPAITPLRSMSGTEKTPSGQLPLTMKFPNKESHSFKEITDFIRTIKADPGLVKLLQRSIRKSYTQKTLDSRDELTIDGDWGGGSEKALRTVLTEKLGAVDNNPIPSDVIKEILFSWLFSVESPPTPLGSTASTKEETEADDPKEETEADDPKEETQADDPKEETEADDTTAISGKIEELNTQIRELKDSLRIKEDETENLNQQIFGLQDQAKANSNKTIQEMVDDIEMQFQGKDNSGTLYKLSKKSIDYDGCRIKLDQNIKRAKLQMHMSDCVEYNLLNWEVDSSKEVKIDDSQGGLSVVTVPLQEKQTSYIISIKSDPLPALQGLSTNCYVELEVKDNGQSVGQPVDLYLSEDDVPFFDEGTVEQQRLRWEDLAFKLTLPATEGQKCQLTNDVAIPITTEAEVADPSAPHATISREGAVTLKNLPIVKIEGQALVVFLDTYVGNKGSKNYAFNSSLDDRNMQEIQKKYFGGFINGLKQYLTNDKQFESVEIFTSNTNDLDFQSVLGGHKNESGQFSEELFSAFSSYVEESFEAGLSGFFSDKKLIYKKLLKQNPNTTFLSFGSSGKQVETICSANRADFRPKSYIFDILKTATLENLDKEEKISKLEEYFYQCDPAERIFGVRESKFLEQESIKDFVYKRLKELDY